VWRWTTTAALVAARGHLLGPGGGVVVVRMLRKLTQVPIHGIVAPSLMAIALVRTGGVVPTALRGTVPPVALTIAFSFLTAAGMLAARHMEVGFAVVLFAVALT
jgi:hypothetical protein